MNLSTLAVDDVLKQDDVLLKSSLKSIFFCGVAVGVGVDVKVGNGVYVGLGVSVG